MKRPERPNYKYINILAATGRSNTRILAKYCSNCSVLQVFISSVTKMVEYIHHVLSAHKNKYTASNYCVLPNVKKKFC